MLCEGLRSSLRENGEKEEIYPFVHLQQNKIVACQDILKKMLVKRLPVERWKCLKNDIFTIHHSVGDSTYGASEKASHCNRPCAGRVVKIQIPEEFTVSND